MIDSKELRIGNWVFDDENKPCQISSLNSVKRKDWEGWDNQYSDSGPLVEFEDYENIFITSVINPIPLTPEWLEKLGFTQLLHFTVQNTYNIAAGRDRIISVACVGTPNEMVFINEEEPPEVKNIIVARNYDFDGKTYVHQIQNLFWVLTNEELKIKIA